MRFITLSLCLLFAVSTVNALKPKKDYFATPDAVSFPGFRSFEIETPDHYKLMAWKLPARSPDRHISILIAGGDAGNMSNFLPIAFALTSNGYTVYTFDYRGFGSSSSFPIDTSFLYYNEFSTDLLAAALFAKNNLPDNKLAIYSFSMGSIMTARIWKESTADYLIAEGLVINPLQVQQRLLDLKGRHFQLPADAAFHGMTLVDLPQKMLVFCGNSDPITRLEDAKSLQLQHSGVVIVPFDGGHGGGFSSLMSSITDGPYMDAIKTFTKP